jgi:hypothetical protein
MNDSKNDIKLAQNNPPKKLKIKTSTVKPAVESMNPELPCAGFFW